MQTRTANGESTHVLQLLSRLICPQRKDMRRGDGDGADAIADIGADGDNHNNKPNHTNGLQLLFGEVTRVLRTAVRTLGIFLVEKVPIEGGSSSASSSTSTASTKSVRVAPWALQLGVSLAIRIRCRYDLEYADSPDTISRLLSSTPIVVEVLKCIQELLHKAADRHVTLTLNPKPHPNS